MLASHPAVHPVAEDLPPPPPPGDENPQFVRMRDVPGAPGTPGGLALRLFQFVVAAAAFSVMYSIADFTSVTSFCYFVAAMFWQSLWSLCLAFVDIYALLIKRRLRNPRVLCLFAIGDGFTCTLTFAAACASAGIAVLIRIDLNRCSQNPCISLDASTAMAFLSWFSICPSFLLNLWSVASR